MSAVPVGERILAKIAKRGFGECWLWTGGVGQKGTPNVSVKKRTFSARRLYWEMIHGPLARNRQVSTNCGEPRCMNPDHLYLRPWMDDVTRFWSHVQKAEGAGCWEWQSTLFERGYGSFSMLVDGVKKDRQAHRVSWEMANGAIADGLFVCHRCDNPLCVRPDHLFLGTVQDNNADMIAKGRNSRGEKHAAAVKAAIARKAS